MPVEKKYARDFLQRKSRFRVVLAKKPRQAEVRYTDPMLPTVPHPRPSLPSSMAPRAYFGGFQQPPLPKQTNLYMRGECGHLALAAHKQWPGSQIWRVGLGHFAVELPDGMFVDIRGKMTVEQVWSGLAGPEMIPLSREQVVAELDTGVYRSGFYSERAERSAGALLRQLLPPPPAPRRSPRP